MQMRRQFWAAGLALALMLGSAVRAEAQVLEQVPGDAIVVFKVKNLGGLNAKLAKWAKGLGLDVENPELADPLGALMAEAKMEKGIDRAGDLAIAYVDPASVGETEDEKSILLLVPTSDYAEFLKNFKSTAPDGGVTKATPQEGEDVYVANWGKFAAMSPSKGLLGKKPTGLKLEGASAKESDAKDAIVYANLKALRAKALPELKKGREQFLAKVEEGMKGGGEKAAKFVPLVKVVVGQYLSVAEQFLTDARGATVGFNVGDAGIATTVLADFEPESYLGKLATSNKNVADSMLAGLPNKKYFVYGGAINTPGVSEKVLGDLIDPIAAEVAKIPEAKGFVEVLEGFKKAQAATQSSTFGWLAPAGAMGAESLFQQIVLVKGDAKQVRDFNLKGLSALADLMKLLPGQEGMSVKFDVQQGGKTVEGVPLDRFETKMVLDADNEQAAQFQQIMQMVYGPHGQTGVMGVVDPKTFLTVSGASDALISESVTAAKAGADVMGAGAGVRSVAAEMPKQRSAVFYIAVDTMVGTAVRYAKGFGLPVNVKLAANLPPVGVTAGTEGSAIRLDVFVPQPLVQDMVRAGIEATKEQQKQDGGL